MMTLNEEDLKNEDNLKNKDNPNRPEKAASGACGHFVGNPVVLRTF